jgi:hypothetical protein
MQACLHEDLKSSLIRLEATKKVASGLMATGACCYTVGIAMLWC